MNSTDIIAKIHQFGNDNVTGDGLARKGSFNRLNGVVDGALKTVPSIQNMPAEGKRACRLAILSLVEGKIITTSKEVSHKNTESMLARWANENDGYRPNGTGFDEIVTLWNSVKFEKFLHDLQLARGQTEMVLQ